MGSQRKEIRARVRELLLDHTQAQLRVSTNRAEMIWKEALPAIVIYSASEEIELEQVSPPEYTRTLKLFIELLVQETPIEDSEPDFTVYPDDDVDDLGDEIEQILFRTRNLDLDYVQSLKLVSSEMKVASGAEGLIGAERQTWEVIYYTAAPEGDPGAIDDWQKADTKFSVTE